MNNKTKEIIQNDIQRYYFTRNIILNSSIYTNNTFVRKYIILLYIIPTTK